MALGNGFKTQNSAAGASKWGGVKSAQPRSPQFTIGFEYEAKFIGAESTANPKTGEWIRLTFQVKTSNDPALREGDEAVVIVSRSSKAVLSGVTVGKILPVCVALAGFESDEEFFALADQIEPEGRPLDILLALLSREENGLLNSSVRVRCLRGEPIPDKPGDYYPEHRWSPAPTA